MENTNCKNISVEEYRNTILKIDQWTNFYDCERIIEDHKKLCGTSCKDNDVEDCGVAFLEHFLSYDWGRSKVYNYSKEAEEFLQSEYLSNYFKERLKSMFEEMDKTAGGEYLYTPEMAAILNSSKTINEMDENEINYIFFCLKIYVADNNKYKYKYKSIMGKKIYYTFQQLLYKLNGEGVLSFIKNSIGSRGLAVQLLKTSGLSDRASYYSGRGVNDGDLNENNLVSIFNKLLKLDIAYATNFVEMVHKMKTLGATEFITTFINFAINGFKTESLIIEDSNISFDGFYGPARDTVAFISILSSMSRGNNQDYQIMASEQMKNSFMSRIRPILQSINPDYDGLTGQSSDLGYCPKK